MSGKKRKSGRLSITQHWLRNNLGVVVGILVVLEILLIVVVRNYYYSSTRQYLTSKMKIVTTAVVNASGDEQTNYNSQIRSLVESYDEKDKIELMAIKTDGEVDVTSSGFSPSENDNMTDYEDAKKSDTGIGTQIYELSTGEKVMAITSVISPKGSEYEALRMLSSMKNIDHQIFIMSMIITAIVVAVIMLMFFSGMFFIKSIVLPIRSINSITRRYATGDFSERLEKKRNDELGELCDSINYMAQELSNTEQMKNEFISSVSHELRTPLTAIRGWTETVTSSLKQKSRSGCINRSRAPRFCPSRVLRYRTQLVGETLASRQLSPALRRTHRSSAFRCNPSYPCPRPGAVGRRIWLSPPAAGQESRDSFSGALTDGRGQRKENLAAFALLGIGKRKGGRVRAAISPVRASDYSLFVLSARLSPQPIVRAFAHLPGAPPGTLAEPLRVDHRARHRADRPFLHFVLLSSSGTLTDRRGNITKLTCRQRSKLCLPPSGAPPARAASGSADPRPPHPSAAPALPDGSVPTHSARAPPHSSGTGRSRR